MIVVRLLLLCCLLHCVLTVPQQAFGQAPEPDPLHEKMREHIDKSMDEFEIRTKTTSEVAKGELVLRWDNRIRGAAHGCTWIFYDKQKHPIAIASVFPFRETMNHEFDVLDRRAGVSGRRDGKPFWNTGKEAMVRFKPVPEAPIPAVRKRIRQTQLKLLAAQFSAASNGWSGDDEEGMRMLPTPVYRYGFDAEKSDVLEGGVFLFVQGIDPEAALLLEAYRENGEYRWEYALIPQTSALLSAKHKKKIIWTKRQGHATPGHVDSLKYVPEGLRDLR